MALLLLVAGCNAPEAPDNIEELVVYGFVHQGDDEGFVAAAAEGMPPLAELNATALAEGLLVDTLSPEDVEAVGLVPRRELDVSGVAELSDLGATLDQLAVVLVAANLEDVYNGTLAYEIDVGSEERACFLAHTCDTLTFDGTRETEVSIFGTATQAFTTELRWVETDKVSALAFRTLVPDPTEVSSEFLKIYQSYAYGLLFADGAGTRKVEAQWVDAEVIGMDLPETVVLEMAVDAMSARAEELDAFAQGG